MKSSLRWSLALLMFLQFLVAGLGLIAWRALGEATELSRQGLGNVYANPAWGALLLPLVAGLLADRFLAAPRILGWLHIAGACLLAFASRQSSGVWIFWVLFAYAFTFPPTLALVNAVVFRFAVSVGPDFLRARLFGALGGMAALACTGFLIGPSVTGLGAARMALALAAGAALWLGLFSFTLPKPQALPAGKASALNPKLLTEVFALMKDRAFVSLLLAVAGIAIPSAFFHQLSPAFLRAAGGIHPPVLSFGLEVAAEAIGLLLIPLLLMILSRKSLLILGLAAWTFRFFCLALGARGSMAWIYSGLIVHGLGMAWFWVFSQLYLESKAPPVLSARAQSLFVMAGYGLGSLLGSGAARRVVGLYFRQDGLEAWASIWWVPLGMSVLGLLGFGLFFRDEKAAE